jgi:hypothetical protein
MASADMARSLTDLSPFQTQDGNGAALLAAARTLDGIGNWVGSETAFHDDRKALAARRILGTILSMMLGMEQS